MYKYRVAVELHPSQESYIRYLTSTYISQGQEFMHLIQCCSVLRCCRYSVHTTNMISPQRIHTADAKSGLGLYCIYTIIAIHQRSKHKKSKHKPTRQASVKPARWASVSVHLSTTPIFPRLYRSASVGRWMNDEVVSLLLLLCCAVLRLYCSKINNVFRSQQLSYDDGFPSPPSAWTLGL